MIAFVTILGVVTTFLTVSILIGTRDTRRLRLLDQERQGESICTLAPTLNYRSVDTTVIRAVHEEKRLTDFPSVMGEHVQRLVTAKHIEVEPCPFAISASEPC